MAIGLTTGAYAISLMAASTLQIQHDRAVIEDRAPVADAITLLSDHHDDMTTRLELARARYAAGADGYGALITRLDAMRDRLASMDKTVTAIEKANGALAAKIPGVPIASQSPGVRQRLGFEGFRDHRAANGPAGAAAGRPAAHQWLDWRLRGSPSRAGRRPGR